jgi:hypothetical protein
VSPAAGRAARPLSKAPQVLDLWWPEAARPRNFQPRQASDERRNESSLPVAPPAAARAETGAGARNGSSRTLVAGSRLLRVAVCRCVKRHATRRRVCGKLCTTLHAKKEADADHLDPRRNFAPFRAHRYSARQGQARAIRHSARPIGLPLLSWPRCLPLEAKVLSRRTGASGPRRFARFRAGPRCDPPFVLLAGGLLARRGLAAGRAVSGLSHLSLLTPRGAPGLLHHSKLGSCTHSFLLYSFTLSVIGSRSFVRHSYKPIAPLPTPTSPPIDKYP